MIEVEELSKRFKTKQALDGVSFTAEDGKVTGFLGPNGAGKSTTMRAALGLISPDKGRWQTICHLTRTNACGRCGA